MRRLLMLLTFVFIANTILGQSTVTVNSEDINLIDSKLLKQGEWKLFSNTLRMNCIFKDNKVIDTIKYYDNDNLVFELSCKNNGKRDWAFYSKGDTIRGFSKYNEEDLYRYYNYDGEELDSLYSIFSAINEYTPHYYGGTSEMNKYIGSSSISKLKKGKYYVSFVINSNGYVEDVKVINSNKKKVIKIINKVFLEMPRWQAGHQRGIMVKSTYYIPLNIK